MDWVLLDFETRSRCDLKRAGAWVYAEHPSTEVLCMGYSERGADPVSLWKPGEPVPAFVGRPGVVLVSHNAQFEKAIWRTVLKWPEPARWVDSMASCARKALPLDLLGAGRALGLSQTKDQRGKALLRQVTRPGRNGVFDTDPEAMRLLHIYCIQDVRAEVALLRRVGSLPAEERAIWEANERLNERGLGIDADYVRACQAVSAQAQKPLAAELANLTGGLAATQREKLLWWLNMNGAALEDLSRQGVLDALEDRGAAMAPEVRRALELRLKLTAASHAKLEAMLACRGADGRARGLLQYHGAATGRVAGRLLQPANFPRGRLSVSPSILVEAIMTHDADYVAATVGDPVDAITTGLRHAIVAAPGKLLMAADFASIEARLLLALAGANSALDIIRSGQDIYCSMAEKIYKRPITKADAAERQIGKAAVLGLGYAMGWRQFQARSARTQPDEFAQSVVAAYRRDFAPEVPRLWYALDEAATRAVWDRKPVEAYGIEYSIEDCWLTCRLPSGRKLFYFRPERETTLTPWGADRRSFSYTAFKGGAARCILPSGGHLTENIIQAMARDLLEPALQKAEAAGLLPVLQVYDELVVEVEKKLADPIALTEIMMDTPDWARELRVPVTAEGWAGERYRK